jgi:hypothetical protein
MDLSWHGATSDEMAVVGPFEHDIVVAELAQQARAVAAAEDFTRCYARAEQ